MRGDQEIIVVVRRQGELLVMRRAPERLGYWSLVVRRYRARREVVDGGRARAARGDRARGQVRKLSIALSYSLLDDPPAIRARYAPGIERVTVHAFVTDAPDGWEPTLDAEHDLYRWCDLEQASSSWLTRPPATRCARALRHRESRDRHVAPRADPRRDGTRRPRASGCAARSTGCRHRAALLRRPRARVERGPGRALVSRRARASRSLARRPALHDVSRPRWLPRSDGGDRARPRDPARARGVSPLASAVREGRATSVCFGLPTLSSRSPSSRAPRRSSSLTSRPSAFV